MNDLFIGYDEDFYDAIPWVAIDGGDTPAYESDYVIDPSFTVIAAKLLFRKNNEKVYREYGLPEDDAVKAAVLESPELLFYAPELSRLLDMIQKPGLMLKLIGSDQIIHDLSELHRFPGMFDFIELYHKYAGPDELVYYLEDLFPLIGGAARSYAAMDKNGKARTESLLRISHDNNAHYTIVDGFPYSEPIETRNRHARDRSINGFVFKRLASGRDLNIAGARVEREELYKYGFYVSETDDELYAVHSDRFDYMAVLEVHSSVLTNIYTYWEFSLADSKLLAAILQWLIEVGVIMAKDVLNES